LLTNGGILLFVPQSQRSLKNTGARRRPQTNQYGLQYPQMQYQPQYDPRYNIPQYTQQPYQGQATGIPVNTTAGSESHSGVPFPEEEARFAQPQGGEHIK
jgi:hypothetical protein